MTTIRGTTRTRRDLAITPTRKFRTRPEPGSGHHRGHIGGSRLIDANSLHLESPIGLVHTEFTPINTYGILDHVVTLPDGTKVLNPFRVIPHDTGSELTFTVRPSENFEEDCQAVAADLERLVALAEK
ncbi:hypothetical protein JJQ73_13305 [Corynebacterium glutamicum]|uniref:hypothetical protein n=1 Tax=Corynebacterium glutamicum TaxID=1718 RepID=UPI001C6E41B8|nr:hypothetical protein [Corynebacterium glutamicum]QYR19006.1 hypothetical protein JJQ73_13305 [Corynebacterium glutamicum]